MGWAGFEGHSCVLGGNAGRQAQRVADVWRGGPNPRKITSGVGPQNVPHVPPVGACAAVPNARNLPAIGGWQRAGAPACRTFPSCLGGCDLAGSGSILTTALADRCCSWMTGTQSRQISKPASTRYRSRCWCLRRARAAHPTARDAIGRAAVCGVVQYGTRLVEDPPMPGGARTRVVRVPAAEARARHARAATPTFHGCACGVPVSNSHFEAVDVHAASARLGLSV